MHTALLNFGGTTVKVESEFAQFLRVANLAVPSAKPGVPPDIRLLIRQWRPETQLVPFSTERTGRAIEYQLSTPSYTYFPELNFYNVTIPEIGSGVISFKEKKIEWSLSQPKLSPRSAFHMLILDPVSLFLPSWGGLIVHAATLSVGQSATLVLGKSGSGKSTLSFLSAHEPPLTSDLRQLADDTALLRYKNGVSDIVVEPIKTGFGLAPQLVNSRGLGKSAILERRSDKIYLQSIPNETGGSLPVSQIVFLERSESSLEETEIRKLCRNQLLKELLRYKTEIGSPLVRERLGLWHKLSRQASGVKIRYSEILNLDTFKNIIRGVVNETK